MNKQSPYIPWEEFNAAITLIYSPDKECVLLGKEILKNYGILYEGKILLRMSYTAGIRIFEGSGGIGGILYINGQTDTMGYLKDLYDTWIRWEINQPVH